MDVYMPQVVGNQSSKCN